MKFYSALWGVLPVLVLACSSDDSDVPTPAVGGTGGAATASAGAAGGGAAGASASAGEGATAAAGSGGASAGGSSEGSSGAVPLDEPGDESISGGAVDAGAEPEPAPAPGTDAGASDPGAVSDTLDDGTMTFFVTSTGMGDGGNLGGLEGADAFCEQLAVAQSADFGRRTWRAYLSTSSVNAIDRIGSGPWRNAEGVIVASSSAQLHDPANVAAGGPLDATWPIGNFSIPLDETGAEHANNVHDILTGTLLDGTVAVNETCLDWTSGADDPNINARIGHSNRTGLPGQRQLWQDVHTVGCSQSGNNNVTEGGGRGSFYCFAVITGE